MYAFGVLGLSCEARRPQSRRGLTTREPKRAHLSAQRSDKLWREPQRLRRSHTLASSRDPDRRPQEAREATFREVAQIVLANPFSRDEDL